MTEQPTGQPRPSVDTRPAQRTVLVVDLDGEPLAPLRALEEILLCLGTWEDDDRQDPGADTEPLRLPAPLADRVALAAVQRLLTTLAPTQSRAAEGRQLAPDGRYEHAPMTVLSLPAADIDLLSTTAAALGHPGLDPDITNLVDASAEQLNLRYRRAGRTELVALLARLAGLLDLAPTDDTRLLTARLRATPPGVDSVLSDAEEAAHARTADRMNHLWAHGSAIDRYLY
ncbi:LuxR family transcriptional regulator [Blastococcus sp. TF02-8]|uniref:LuxR family transcriptional regulator n=1 Tax=Blastococcus sp. TF02-8 TaxID=2250574 RepID=UPI000DEA9595|nr:LuxR family transcriptional regulator [Blastococcus sp. TF02-8]RBY96563.1 LuxR family transcriptional regulator [Blastococcus sp. TF02-8]